MSEYRGLSWHDVRALAPAKAGRGDSRATLIESADHQVAAVWWPRMTASALHGHGASATWLHVVTGELVEERWTLGRDGEWRYEVVRVRAGESSLLPSGSYHRVRARTDSSVISTFEPPASERVQAVDPAVLGLLLRARRRHGLASIDRDEP